MVAELLHTDAVGVWYHEAYTTIFPGLQGRNPEGSFANMERRNTGIDT